jgi:hypothetical protein
MSLRRAGGQRAREGRPVAQQREEAQRLTRREASLFISGSLYWTSAVRAVSKLHRAVFDALSRLQAVVRAGMGGARRC